MIKVLIVDDEIGIRMLIQDYLENEGFSTVLGKNGAEAISILENNSDIDLMILDVKMPEMDGFETLEYIRSFSQIPVLFLTALGESYQEVKGLKLGADDYIKKPFTYDVLMARIQLVLRKNNLLQTYVYENLKVENHTPAVYIQDNMIKLRKMEWRLLIYLMQHMGQTLTREQLINEVWGYDFEGDPRTLDTHIKTLRQKLGEYSQCIETERGIGYRFEKNFS
ncbi:MAG: response regulator transcription factor [Clostridia bacterium]|nr:response regulator transcription factor [Clostridia bacterium]